MKKAIIALEDGKIFEGYSFGAEGEKDGEIVFNTSMTGYQEILTDPSYKGQIVTMTYPLIGNYGVNSEDLESIKPHVEGFVIKEYSHIYSNWRAQKSLSEFLKDYGIIGIEGVDTRALTKHIRTQGAMKAVISTQNLDTASLIAKAKDSPGLVGRDLVKEVTCQRIEIRRQKSAVRREDLFLPESRVPSPESRFWTEDRLFPTCQKSKIRYKVVAMDFGIKFNILRMLEKVGCEITLVPASTSSSQILAMNPDGIFLSNGPGDPEGVPYAIDTVREILPSGISIFGICLGHQILGLAFGGKTYKLKFGHRGGNQPVKDFATGKIDITSQNHSFCVDINSLNEQEVEITHINPNDQTLEGMRHKKLPIFSVQYHPEASPGPHDAAYLFDRFIELIAQHKKTEDRRQKLRR